MSNELFVRYLQCPLLHPKYMWRKLNCNLSVNKFSYYSSMWGLYIHPKYNQVWKNIELNITKILKHLTQIYYFCVLCYILVCLLCPCYVQWLWGCVLNGIHHRYVLKLWIPGRLSIFLWFQSLSLRYIGSRTKLAMFTIGCNKDDVTCETTAHIMSLLNVQVTSRVWFNTFWVCITNFDYIPCNLSKNIHHKELNCTKWSLKCQD